MEIAARSVRALSFGRVAEDYDRFRPGPPAAVLDWLLPPDCRAAVDIGAGTGLLTRLLVQRVEQVTAVEPDERMRAVLAERVPAARVLAGRGEALPLPDASADAVFASSAWHWVDPDEAVPEVARVLRSGGRFGLLWTSVDVEAGGFGEFWSEVRPGRRDRGRNPARRGMTLPVGAPFTEPESTVVRASITLSPADLVGLVQTYSGVITLSPEDREQVRARAESLVAERFGDRQLIEVPLASRCWRATRR